ncbi:FTR1 family protein [Sporosarcina sp. E16_3]|uniref:FTR1 family protein n=1 Tax=Sporosarcina sp. E16_3 TaxID=2789293 RepID=UPI0031FE0629
MRHFLAYCSQISFIALLFFTLITTPVEAAESYGELYISISDAIMGSKQENDAEAIAALDTFKEDWQKLSETDNVKSQEIEQALQLAFEAESSEIRLKALTNLSKALHTLEKAENPVDEKAQRKAFDIAIQPSLKVLHEAIQSGDKTTMEATLKNFISNWKKSERPVREQDLAAYGKIETQTAFIRISLAEDEPNTLILTEQFNVLTTAIQNFVSGKKVVVKNEGYSLATLIDLLDDSKVSIKNQKFDEAAKSLREFITIWPNVEGDIRTKNAKLYTKIENEIPILVSDLSKQTVDEKGINVKLDNFKQQIALLQGNTTYNFLDSALILLREGLEALLIMIGLIAFLKRSGQEAKQKWIYLGALGGITVSAVAAILMSTLFQSLTIGTSREMMEGYIGLSAAVLMLGVGIWLHSKSSVISWNQYISKQMGNAISKQSVWAMAFISFLSVFREGAETIVFYAGIAPKMPTVEFISGIVLAIIILVIIAFLLLRISGRIPVHRFFLVATVLIYVLAFKIIGVSLHTLQLTNVVSMTVVKGLPILNGIGFYPTAETIIAQAILLVTIVITIVYKRRVNVQK